MKSAPYSTTFSASYAAHRAAEGRGHSGDELLALPYLSEGPLAKQWRVRAKTFDAFRRRYLGPAHKPLRLLDIGAGNGWLSYRTFLAGHTAVALDIRTDTVDGLGAARGYLDRTPGCVQRVAASFEALPFGSAQFDLAVFNASIHYALDLDAVLTEAARVVRPGGRLLIMDSPFYAAEGDGEAMVAEKKRAGAVKFGGHAGVLLAPSFVEFLTPSRLAKASTAAGLSWRRHRVFYPLWYELRPVMARVRGGRTPSRFDLWAAEVP